MFKKLLKNKEKEQKGFTLVELLVVMAIIAVLVTLIITAINIARRASRDTQRRNNANSIKAALEDNYSRNKVYPDTPGTDDLTGINGMLGIGLSDPNGEDARYYYKLGTCSDSSKGKYVLRILTEGMDAGYNPSAKCDTGEDFSNN